MLLEIRKNTDKHLKRSSNEQIYDRPADESKKDQNLVAAQMIDFPIDS
jgi:hypothetical protein